MNRALWLKALREGWVQLALSSGLLAGFGCLFVWLMSLLEPRAIAGFLGALSRLVQPVLGIPLEELIGVPLAELATTSGRLSVLYVHGVTLLVCIGWAVGRGSDVVSGEIGRGTMDLLLALPIRRGELMAVSAATAALGAAVLALSIWLGSAIGVAIVPLREQVALHRYWPGVVNLFAMTFCLTGLTALLSSWDHSRWRTIWLALGLFAVSSIIKMVARLWRPGAWLKYLSFLTAFEPQQLILLEAEKTRQLAWQYDGTLIGLGLASYALAALVFVRRDIPAAY